MNLRKLRRIQRERSGRGRTTSYRIQYDRPRSEWNYLEIDRRIYITTGNVWRIGIKSNFQ